MCGGLCHRAPSCAGGDARHRHAAACDANAGCAATRNSAAATSAHPAGTRRAQISADRQGGRRHCEGDRPHPRRVQGCLSCPGATLCLSGRHHAQWSPLWWQQRLQSSRRRPPSVLPDRCQPRHVGPLPLDGIGRCRHPRALSRRISDAVAYDPGSGGVSSEPGPSRMAFTPPQRGHPRGGRRPPAPGGCFFGGGPERYCASRVFKSGRGVGGDCGRIACIAVDAYFKRSA